MKFQIPNMHRSEVNGRTHTHTDRQTDRQAESNMPFQLFQSWGHKNGVIPTIPPDGTTKINFQNVQIFEKLPQILRINRNFNKTESFHSLDTGDVTF